MSIWGNVKIKKNFPEETEKKVNITAIIIIINF